jgi:anthranilate synthase component 1
MITEQAFNQFAKQGYNHIPVYQTILADLDTPLSSYLKLAKGPYSFLFESLEGGETWGRYSFIGLPSQQVIKVYQRQVIIQQEGKTVATHEVADPLTFIQQFQARFKTPPVPGLPRFSGGLVGYFGYDTVRYSEPRLWSSQPPDKLGIPDVLLMVANEVLVFDNLRSQLSLVVHTDPGQPQAYSNAQQRLAQLVKALSLGGNVRDLLPASQPSQVDFSQAQHSLDQEQYQAAVDKVKAYTLAGDVMQVVPSRRTTLPFAGHSVHLYRALRRTNPSPYMYHLDLDDFQVVGSSPEILARLEDQHMVVRPLAGTRPRGKTQAEDQRLEQELLADPKELAEHLMLIDLGRNDLGRVAQAGSVQVPAKMFVERYSHVMHISSIVTATLKQEADALDLLRATLPAGTLSGAPKVRAMEIIDEIEPVKRNLYGGAVGYLAWNGNMDMAIAIRTLVIKDRQVNIQVGGGLVADSVPLTEWQETVAKAAASVKAIELVSQGLDSF